MWFQLTQMRHAWNLYQHLAPIYSKWYVNVGKFSSPMEHMGSGELRNSEWKKFSDLRNLRTAWM